MEWDADRWSGAASAVAASKGLQSQPQSKNRLLFSLASARASVDLRP